jgi:2-polyprenyl-6-hydroxyphenyl methylase / 3-demethylubiquinone-9 3-methyltransferase
MTNENSTLLNTHPTDSNLANASVKNADEVELNKFSELAHKWWDKTSEFKPLHDINPLRLGYIDKAVSLNGKAVLDVGCGGGILSESMASLGAKVTGIDLGEKSIKVAQLHSLESGVALDYQVISVEDLAKKQPASFDVVTCLEMLEHVPNPASIIEACAKLVKPGGHVFAVIGAEYVLNMLPRGTHDYAKFIKPSELASWVRLAGLSLNGQIGMSYNPISKRYWLDNDVTVNYMMHAVRPAN